MGIRTGAQFIEGLRDNREVWLGSERVKDVTTHPAFRAPIESLAQLYDMQHDPALQPLLTYSSPTSGDPVGLSKAISKFTKANPDIFTFKAGVVEGKLVALNDVEAIATLPSKEELIAKIMFLINCQAQRLATVISAVPRNLAVVVKQVSEQKTA